MRGVERIPWLYDAICAAYEACGLARWRRWLVAGARGRVLDLGCGTGRNLPLLPPGSVAIGLDPSWSSLQRARRRAPRVPLVVGSAEALPFRAGSFDTVLSGLVFCSVPDARRGLLEARRVLAAGGRLVYVGAGSSGRIAALDASTGSATCTIPTIRSSVRRRARSSMRFTMPIP